MRIVILFFICFVCLFFMSSTSCGSDAEVASYNVSKAADQFEIYRRVVFYNGITDEYILIIEGYCSINVDKYDKQLELTVKSEGQKLHLIFEAENAVSQPICGRRVSNYRMTINVPLANACKNCLKIHAINGGSRVKKQFFVTMEVW